ncbi:MAG: GNAT family N-acetyltransferase [Deltaproteobacteria bacterium]|nr:GNAT family N-acetyltransferase [Deltaproteobacteria bacterium]
MSDSRYFFPVLVEIIPAKADQEPILANLMEFYAHDFSEFVELELGPDGRFGYNSLSLYWKEPGRYPFLIKAGGTLAGFALIQEGPGISGGDPVWDMAEFFIIRGRRRRGIGMKAAHELWRRFPGKWEVRVRERNRGAKEFWAGAIAAFTGQIVPPTAFQKNGVLWQVFSFLSD